MLTQKLKQEWKEFEARERREIKEQYGDETSREIRQEEMATRRIVSRRAKRKITHGPLT